MHYGEVFSAAAHPQARSRQVCRLQQNSTRCRRTARRRQEWGRGRRSV